MRVISDMKIFKKLTLVFITISLLTLIVGIIGINGSNRINNNLKNIYNIDLKGTNDLKELKTNLTEIRADIIYLRDEKNKNDIDSKIKEISDLKIKDNKILNEYKATIVTEQDREAYSNLNNYLAKWRASREKFIELVKQNNYDEADIYYNEVSKYRKLAFSVLDSEISLNLKLADNDYNSSQKIFISAVYISIGVIIAGMALSIVLGMLMGRHINEPIKKIEKMAERFSKFDFSTPIKVTRKDELGKVAASLNSSQEHVAGLVKTIMGNAEDMSAASEELSATSEELSSKAANIDDAVSNIVSGIQNMSASSEEINASVEEVNSSINELSSKTMDQSNSSNDSKNRAVKSNEYVKKSAEETKSLYSERKIK